MSDERTAHPLAQASPNLLSDLVFARLHAMDRRTLAKNPRAALESIKQQTLREITRHISYEPTQPLSLPALVTLSPIQRAVFILCRREGLAFDEVAQILDVSTRVVRKSLSAALLAVVDRQRSPTPTPTSVPE